MPYKAAQTWDWVASSPPRGDTLGPSFLSYSFVKPTSTDNGAIPRHLLRRDSVQSSRAQLPRDTFENLTVLLKTRGWKKSASVLLMSRPLISSFSLLFLPRGWAKAQCASHQCKAPRSSAPSCQGRLDHSGHNFHLPHPCALELQSLWCCTEPAEPPATFST